MKKNKDLLYISIFTLATVFAWIIFDVFHTAVTSTITEVQTELAAPLNPNFDKEAISTIQLHNRP